jgi:hypothetical protein
MPSQPTASTLMRVFTVMVSRRNAINPGHWIEIQLTLTASRFFRRKTAKTESPLPASLPNASSSTLVVGDERAVHRDSAEGASSASSTLCPFSQVLPAPSDPSGNNYASFKLEGDSVKLKLRPSFAKLRSKSASSPSTLTVDIVLIIPGSRLFRSKDNSNETESLPPPPPVPQIPVDPTEPLPHRPTLTPLHSMRNSRSSSIIGHNRNASISRPSLLPQYSSPPIPENPITVPFIKPLGPPPRRPPRPESLDDETIALMQQGDSRMVLLNSNRVSGSTALSSTPRSHTSSIEARLGLPSGHSTPRTNSLESPLAARFPLDVSQPLQVRDSTGSVTVSRFSQWYKHECGGYAGDGVEEDDRDLGPIEQYDKSKENQWKLVKRISKGPNGNPGMLFRDVMGAFHFVADI